jgi:hypothetical protein
MNSSLRLGLAVVAAHCAVLIWHFRIAANILPGSAPERMALVMGIMAVVHLVVFIVWWMRPAGLGSLLALLFFAFPLAAGTYEHFLSNGANNILRMAAGPGTEVFKVSVLLLLFLEICGVVLALRTIRLRTHRPAVDHS